MLPEPCLGMTRGLAQRTGGGDERVGILSASGVLALIIAKNPEPLYNA